MALRLRLLGDRVLVAVNPRIASITPAGLELPPDSTPPCGGTVLAIGPQVKEIHAGDEVVFSPFVGQTVTYDTSRTRPEIILRERDLMAVRTVDADT